MSNEINNGLSDELIDEMVASIAESPEEKTSQPIESADTITEVTRRLLVVGTGDGGCNIAEAIKLGIPTTFAIAYNTSKRAMRNLKVDKLVIPAAEDGSGKDRSYSKEVFKQGAYKSLVDLICSRVEHESFDYILVTTTADGGTGGGASPNVAKVIADNVSIPVIIVGVYPSIYEDAKAQYNTISWQADVEKTGLPYMVFDNNCYADKQKVIMQSSVNSRIVEAAKIIAGTEYGDTNISSIDNRDMHMILVEAGKRINIISTERRPKVNENLDDVLIEEFKTGNMHGQPLPGGFQAIGLFIKGPEEFIKSVDTSLIKFRDVIGEGVVYTHIEKSNKVLISVIVSGSDVAEDRLTEIKLRYSDIVSREKHVATSATDMLSSLSDPFATTKRFKKKKTTESNFSGLDL